MIIGECFSLLVLVDSFLSGSGGGVGTSTELADFVTGLLIADLGVVFVADGDDELAFTAAGLQSALLFGVVGGSFRADFGD